MATDALHEAPQLQSRKGPLELVILAAQREQPRYGLALLRLLQRLPTTTVTEVTSHPLLHRLERDGLVNANWVQEGESRPKQVLPAVRQGKARILCAGAGMKAVGRRHQCAAGRPGQRRTSYRTTLT